MCQIEISPCHLQRKKNKKIFSKSWTRPPKKIIKKLYIKKKKQVSSGQAVFGVLIFPSKRRTKTEKKTKQNRSVSGQAISGLWVFPGQVSPGFGQVPPKPRWRGLLIGRLWTFQVLALRATPKWKPSLQGAFSPPSNLPPRGLLAIFLLENLPVMVARSVVHLQL